MFIEWSNVGEYHIERNEVNQDVCMSADNGASSTIVLADGVSTCSHAKEGAMIACLNVMNYFSLCGNELIFQSTDCVAKKTISNLKHKLQHASDIQGIEINEYSSTIVAVYYDRIKNKLLCINLGDGLVCGVGKNDIEIIMQPQDNTYGCYVTTTKGVEEKAEVKILSAEGYNSVFICSDGMWKQMFKKSKMIEEYKKMILENDYGNLINQININRSFDDRSIIVMTKMNSVEEKIA